MSRYSIALGKKPKKTKKPKKVSDKDCLKYGRSIVSSWPEWKRDIANKLFKPDFLPGSIEEKYESRRIVPEIQVEKIIPTSNRRIFKIARNMYNYMHEKGGWWNPIMTDPPIMGYRHSETGEAVEISIENYNKTVKTIADAEKPNISSSVVYN